MNLRIQVPAELETLLKVRAEQAGLPLDVFVLQTLTDRFVEPESVTEELTEDQFLKWLREWAGRFPQLDTMVDDSRDSIYAGRGE